MGKSCIPCNLERIRKQFDAQKADRAAAEKAEQVAKITKVIATADIEEVKVEIPAQETTITIAGAKPAEKKGRKAEKKVEEEVKVEEPPVIEEQPVEIEAKEEKAEEIKEKEEEKAEN